MLTQSGREAAGLRPRERGRAAPGLAIAPAAPTVRGPLDGRGHDRRHVPVHGARAAGGQGGRRALGHLWALGCVLYEMATGTRAFSGESQASVIAAILHEEPRAMTELRPVTPVALERVVRACLAKDPERSHPDGARSRAATPVDFGNWPRGGSPGRQGGPPHALGAPRARRRRLRPRRARGRLGRCTARSRRAIAACGGSRSWRRGI